MKEYSNLNQVEEGLQELVSAHATVVRPPVVKAVIQKPSAHAPIGVTWRFVRGKGIIIGKISQGGLVNLSSEDLREGMKLLKLNQFNFQDSNDPKLVAAKIREIEDTLTIVAAEDPSTLCLSAVVKKSEQDTDGDEEDGKLSLTTASSLGIEFRRDPEKGITIKSISSSSPFARGSLRAGSKVLMINDLDCREGAADVDEITDYIKNVDIGSVVTIYFEGDEYFLPSRSRAERGGGAPPPPGVDAGGVWGSNVHNGNRTCCASFVCCLIFGWIPAVIVCCFPFDKRRVYKVNHRIYAPSGAVVGMEGGIEFEEGEPTEDVDGEKMATALTIAGAVGFVLTAIFLLLMQQ